MASVILGGKKQLGVLLLTYRLHYFSIV